MTTVDSQIAQISIERLRDVLGTSLECRDVLWPSLGRLFYAVYVRILNTPNIASASDIRSQQVNILEYNITMI